MPLSALPPSLLPSISSAYQRSLHLLFALSHLISCQHFGGFHRWRQQCQQPCSQRWKLRCWVSQVGRVQEFTGATKCSVAVAVNHCVWTPQIRGNLRTVIRALRLFDYNREGHIQQHEFRRILDNYCIHLTDKEFQRWGLVIWHSLTQQIRHQLCAAACKGPQTPHMWTG